MANITALPAVGVMSQRRRRPSGNGSRTAFTLRGEIMRSCFECPLDGDSFVVTSIDGFCQEHRKLRRDTRACLCGAPYAAGQTGWYVPSFNSYIDIFYQCPDCLIETQVLHAHKNKRLKEILAEQDAIREQMTRWKSGPRSKRWRELSARLESIRREKDECWAGSGFIRYANT